MVPLEGLEPPRHEHRYLKPACLPISPQRLIFMQNTFQSFRYDRMLQPFCLVLQLLLL